MAEAAAEAEAEAEAAAERGRDRARGCTSTLSPRTFTQRQTYMTSPPPTYVPTSFYVPAVTVMAMMAMVVMVMAVAEAAVSMTVMQQQ